MGRAQWRFASEVVGGMLPYNRRHVQGIQATATSYAVGPRELGHKLIRALQGRVVSTKMDKTISVEVTQYIRHRLYRRYVKSSSRIFAHDESNNQHTATQHRNRQTGGLHHNKSAKSNPTRFRVRVEC